jgi:hypothetical protein
MASELGFKATNWFFVQLHHCKQALTDNSNCGVYCVQFLEKLLSLDFNLFFENSLESLNKKRIEMNSLLVANAKD